MKVVLANPRGFCAGVVRAIDIVGLALERFGPPIYVRHDIVHNEHVVADFASRGVVFMEHLAHVPKGVRVIFSAHGVGPAVWREAADRALSVIDATCPLVTKVHQEVAAYAKTGRTLEAEFQWAHARDLKPEPEDLVKIKQKLANGLSDETSAANGGKKKPDGG